MVSNDRTRFVKSVGSGTLQRKVFVTSVQGVRKGYPCEN